MSMDNAGFLSSFTKWIDSGYSPVNSLSKAKLQRAGGNWWVYDAKLNNLPAGNPFSTYSLSAAGTSISEQEAFLRCAGETVERYTLFNSLRKPELRHTTLSPRLETRLPYCRDEENCQQSFKRNPSGKRYCVGMTHLLSAEQEWIPAEYVYLDIAAVVPETDMLAMPITTGVAFHPHFVNALFSGILEVVERDTFMKCWLQKQPPAKISFTHGAPHYSIQLRLQQLKDSGLEASLFHLDNFCSLPTVFCVIKSREYPYTSVGISTKAGVTEAIVKAIDEAVSLRIAAQFHREKPPGFSLQDFSWIRRLEDHLLLYAWWPQPEALDFVLDSGASVRLEELTTPHCPSHPATVEQLQHFCRRAFGQTFTVYYKDLTIAETAQFGHTVRVFIPEAVPLAQSHNARWLGAASWPPLDLAALNPFPHPFA